MSGKQSPRRTARSDAEAPDEDLSPEARRLVAYLRERVEREGPFYVKSRFVAEEIDLSPKQVGSYMAQLRDGDADLSVEEWSYTNGTTWYVSR